MEYSFGECVEFTILDRNLQVGVAGEPACGPSCASSAARSAPANPVYACFWFGEGCGDDEGGGTMGAQRSYAHAMLLLH